MLRFDRKQQNSVKQLSFNKKINWKKKKKRKVRTITYRGIRDNIIVTRDMACRSQRGYVSLSRLLCCLGRRFRSWCYAKSLQSCPTLCDPIDGSPAGFPFPGILQVRTLEWAAISFSNARKWKVKVRSRSRVWLLATSWTAA